MIPLAELVPVEDVQPGDVLRKPSGATNVVVYVAGPYEDGTRVVVYKDDEEASYENKARDKSGFNLRARAVEKSWKPLPAGECVPLVRRGDQAALTAALRELHSAALARENAR